MEKLQYDIMENLHINPDYIIDIKLVEKQNI